MGIKGKYTAPEGSKSWEHLTAFTCSIMGLCIGTVIGWNSPSIVKLMAPDSPIPIIASEASTLIAMLSIGHTLISPLGTLVINIVGRKNTILLSALPLMISWSLITVATNVWILYVARLMAGTTTGLFLGVFPIYLGEIASSSSRGAGVTLVVIMFNSGILGAFIIVPYLSISIMAGVFLAMTVGFAVSFWFMPNSPYYLVMKGKMDEAEETLEKLRGKTDVSEERELIIESVKSSNQPNRRKLGGIKELFIVRGNRRAFIIINLLTFVQHFGGYFTIIMYAQLIFKSTTNVISDYMATIVIGVVQLVSAIITTFVIDRIGRKPLMFLSGCIATISNLVIGVFFCAKDYLNADVSAYYLAPFISAMLLVFAFNCGPLNLQVVVTSEIFATEVKAVGVCLVGIISGCMSIIMIKVYILIAVTWSYGNSPLFMAFFAIMAVSTVVILYLLPETKGKTFVQIQKELND